MITVMLYVQQLLLGSSLFLEGAWDLLPQTFIHSWGSSIYTVYFRNGKDASCSMNSCSSCILLTNVHTTHQANTQCHYSLAPLAHTHCQSPNRVQPCLVILSEVDSMKKQHTQSLSSMDTGYLVEAAGSRDSSWWSMAHSCYFVHKKSLETATWLPSLPINNDLLCKL